MTTLNVSSSGLSRRIQPLPPDPFLVILITAAWGYLPSDLAMLRSCLSRSLPDLTIDDKGDAVDGAGRPVPNSKFAISIFLGSNGNSYYDEEGTRLAASLKKSGTQDPSPPKPPAKTPLPLRTWTSATGTYTIQARFVSLKTGVLTLERESGKTITLQVEKLSKTDRAYAKAKAASK